MSCVPMAIGSFNVSYSRCSSPNCRCRNKDNPQKHIGYNVSYSIKGKSKAKRVRKAEVEFAQNLTSNYKKHRGVVLELGQTMMELVREVGFEQAQEFYSAKNPMKEVGKAILTMPVLVGNIDPLEVKQAMETISQKKLSKYIKKTFGESLLVKRSRLKFQLKNKKLDEGIMLEKQKSG